jgi:hypothetical protein
MESAKKSSQVVRRSGGPVIQEPPRKASWILPALMTPKSLKFLF